MAKESGARAPDGSEYVTLTDGAGSLVSGSGTAVADDADFTAGTTQATPVMGAYQSSPTAVTDGDMGIIGITTNREVKINAPILGETGDAASTTTTIKAALRAIATALGVTALDLGVGTGGSRTQRVAVDSSQIPTAGQTTPAASVPVVEAKLEYETVAASQTDQMMGPTGATGDYLSHLLVIPATTSPGGVSIEDGATNIVVFTGGADSVLTLHPFVIHLGIASVSGGWEITTGANVSVIAVGNFT